MASAFDLASEAVSKAANGAVTGARSLATSVSGQVSGSASGLLAQGGAAIKSVGGADLGGIVGSVGGNTVAGAAAGTLLGGTSIQGIVNDPMGAVGAIVGDVQDVASNLVGFVSGTNIGTLVEGVGSEIVGAISSEGGVIGAVAGIIGAVGDSKAANATWGKLNPKLIANFFACDSNGTFDASEDFVNAPITDASIDFTYNWQSPFENTGPESKAPALMAMLQSGQFASVINALQTVLPDALLNASGGMLDEVANKARDVAKSLEGRTGITRLNSRQVFSGMPPIKISLTLHLRALKDPEREIYALYQRLLRWSLPQQLAADGTLSSIIRQGGSLGSEASQNGAMQALKQSGDATVKALFPSLAPMMVGMTYGGQVFKPMVIETISNPLDGPRYRDGKYTYLPVQITLSTLTALDRSDVAKMFLNY